MRTDPTGGIPPQAIPIPGFLRHGYAQGRKLSADRLCELGRAIYQDRSDLFGILPVDLRHLFLAGKTGNGKSTVILNAIRSDMQTGHGVSAVDPRGDLADSVLAAVPKERTNDVVLIDPGDRHFPVALNPLDVDAAVVDVTCDGVVSTFRKCVWHGNAHTPPGRYPVEHRAGPDAGGRHNSAGHAADVRAG